MIFKIVQICQQQQQKICPKLSKLTWLQLAKQKCAQIVKKVSTFSKLSKFQGHSLLLGVGPTDSGRYRAVSANPVTRVSDMSGGRVDHKQTPSSLPTLVSL